MSFSKFSLKIVESHLFQIPDLSQRISIVPHRAKTPTKISQVLFGISTKNDILKAQPDTSLKHKNRIPFSPTSNDHEKILLFKYLLSPIISRGKKGERVRNRPTEFKTLNAMYQLNKNVIRGDWEVVACGKKRIKNTGHISRKAVTKFITGEGLVFFKKTRRFQATNIYKMHEWVIDVFRFFEKKGMMKGIMEDYDKWREVFLRRLNKWLLPLLEKGNTLKHILMNKICTKPKLKGAYPNPLKGASIKPSGFYESFQGIINGTLSVPSFRIKEIETMFLSSLRKSCEDIGWFARKGNCIRNPVGLLAQRFADHLRPRKV